MPKHSDGQAETVESNVITLPGACRRSPVECPDAPPPELPQHRPAAYYWRRDIKATWSLAKAQGVALVVIEELELLHEWFIEQNMKIPRWFAGTSEAKAKGWWRENEKEVPHA